MKSIEEYYPSGEGNDRIIQKALREIDMDTALCLCAGLGDKAQMIYRNLSRRVDAQIRGELEEQLGTIPEARLRAARVLFQKKLLKYETMGRREREDPRPVRLDFSGMDEIRDSFHYLYKLNKAGEVGTMEQLIGEIESPSLRRQMETLLFADDPLSAEAVIDRMARRLKEELAARQALIREGLLSLLSEEPEEIFMEKLYD